MKVLFVAGLAPIVPDAAASTAFYRDALGIPLEGDDYLHTDRLEGTKHFGLWPIADAARSCFGTDRWPEDIPMPQAVIELEVEDVAEAAAEMKRRGYRLLTDVKTEPYTPWMRGQ